MPLQLTANGLEVKPRAEIRNDILTRLQASPTLGPGIRTDASSAIVDALNVMVEQYGLGHEAMLDLYQAFSRQAAEGASLDNLAELVFVSRLAATRSTGTVTVDGTPGTLIPGSSRVRVPGGPTFRLTGDVTILLGGTAVLVESVDTGPIEANAGTITEIVDAVAGWDTVTNAAAVTPGRNQQSDEDLRRAIAQSQQTGRAATDNAIRTALEREVENILSVLVVSNRTLAEDADGIAPKSTRAVLWPSTVDTAQVAETLWRNWAAGIGFDGSQTATITDDQGYSQTVAWDWATAVNIYLEIDVETGAAFPADGEQQIRDAVDEYALTLGVGDDVRKLPLSCLIEQIAGVVDITIRVGDAPSPVSSSPFPIGVTEIADLDSTAPRTVVTIT